MGADQRMLDDGNDDDDDGKTDANNDGNDQPPKRRLFGFMTPHGLQIPAPTEVVVAPVAAE